jgi:hypothetical protein
MIPTLADFSWPMEREKQDSSLLPITPRSSHATTGKSVEQHIQSISNNKKNLKKD